jgi:ATP-dependent Clp protease ATP-binding subunit ClpC
MPSNRIAQTSFHEATRLLQLGDTENAVAALRKALELDERYVDAARLLGHALAETRTWTRAVDAFRLAIALDRAHAPTYTGLGDALLHCGCAHAATEAFDLAIQLDARSSDAWLGKGRALRSLDDSERAVACYQQALSLRSDDFRAARGLAACLESLGRHHEVLALWEAVLERHPDASVAQRGREAALRALRAGPAPEYTPPVPVTRSPAQQQHAWALALATDGRVADALDAMREALQLKDDLPHAYRDLGRLLADLEQWEGAIEAFRIAVQRTPLDASAAVGLARSLFALGRTDEALTVFEEAAQRAPREVELFTAYGDHLRRLKRYEVALEQYQRALTIDPHDLEALVGRATTLVTQGRHADAHPVWRRVLRIAPDHPIALRGLKRSEREQEESDTNQSARRSREVARIHFDIGNSALQDGRNLEAVHAFRRAAAARKDWAEPWFYAGIASSRVGNMDEAAEAFRATLEREPAHLEAACHLGDLLRSQSEFAAARAAYEAALAHSPSLVHAIGGRAETLRMLGLRREAVDGFELALRHDPRDFVSLCGLAALLNGERRFDEARVLWERARTVQPRSPFVARGLAECEVPEAPTAMIKRPAKPAVESVPPPPTITRDDRQAAARQAACDELDRGRSFHKERNYAAAIGAFQRAIELDATLAEASLRLGMAYEDDRQFRRAIQAYERCLELDPKHVQAATNIGEAHRKNEQYVEAIQAYDRAMEVRSDYLYALAGRAECMRMLGQYEDSIVWFDRALAVNAKHAFAVQGKAATLNALQRFTEARELWLRALEIEPTSQFARDGLKYCEAQIKQHDPDDPEERSSTESPTPTLDEQGRDLTALAHAGALPQVIGRVNEIRAVMKTLVRRLKANPLLLGDPGVGKTAVVEGVAQRLILSEAPARLRGLRIIELSMGSLVAGTKYRGTFEERLREIVKEARSNPGIVLFIDEIHTLVGAGRTEGGSLDAANILKPALARGDITVIGATTHAEYRKHFETDSALERRFQPISIDEPSEAECAQLLTRVSGSYEEHHGVEVLPSAIEACVKLAVRYVPERRLPDKALDLLDEACAEASLSGTDQVDDQVVARVVSERTGVPAHRLTEEERTRMSHMERTLSERVVGQRPAIDGLAGAVRLAKAGLRADKRPRGVFLFRGPSGVGKTELAKALADFLFPEGDALIRLDMSEYADRFTASRLLGAPPGYSGHGEEGQLSGPLRRKPYSVVLLDEFEKAHPDVQAVFLSLLDEGSVTDSEGRRINAREAFFVLTTNAGTERRGGGKVGFGSDRAADREALLEQLKGYLRPELLNRIDEVVTFERLDDASFKLIAQLHLERLGDRAKAAGVALAWTDEVCQVVARRGIASQEGARPVLRAIDTLVGEPLSRLLLAADRGGDRRFRAVVRRGDVVLEPDEARVLAPMV